MSTPIKTTVVNESGYAAVNSPNRIRRLTVEFICDIVPGTYHDPLDLMREIASHQYVKSVTLES